LLDSQVDISFNRMDIKDFYTRTQAAQSKGVSVRTLDRWIHAGKIGFTTLHRSILIHKADFDKFTPQVVYGKSRKRRNKVGG